VTYSIDQSRSSPNHSSRFGASIKMIVLHATVGSYPSSLSWLTSAASKVSSHYLIRKDGHIAQLVKDEQAAWHAGQSFWRGMGSEAIELSSLGIELENANTGHDPYPAAQLDACHWLCQQKVAVYGIVRVYVVRHLDIAIPSGRKTDPAGFPWPSFADRLYDHAAPPAHRWRVKSAVTAGATIRSAASHHAAILGRLRSGDVWEGEAIETNESTFVKGFGSSKVWIEAPDGRAIWAPLLEEVK
jgi:N-acetyl-anhydromuramyl-L-alanine amidase AmpD